MFDLTGTQLLLVLIPALPLAAALVTAVLGPRLLGSAGHVPTVLALGASFCLSVVLLSDVRWQSTEATQRVGWETVVNLWDWAVVDDAVTLGDRALDFRIAISLRADALTAMMLSMVTFVATLVAIYAVAYMRNDEGYWRFFSYVSLFVFSMTMLVSVSNFVLLYVFWEAVGVCSYLLIGFWYTKPEAADAGKKAFLVNRVGDFGFALALFLIWSSYGTLNFHDTDAGGAPLVTVDQANQASAGGDGLVRGVLGQMRLAGNDFVGGAASTESATVATAICLLLLLGACGKSAQFPLHVWLPDAMEGPTPVSALIHAATMVTAGVYMIARCTPLFAVSPDAQLVVACVGGFTALLAAVIAFTQTDLKRVLAYSTISQLGYMFLALGTGSRLGIVAGMFHLFTHAFFKALLFLGAGSVMHAMGGVIDMRRFGGLRRLMPITHGTFLAGSLALAGLIPFAGYYSKDEILLAVYEGSAHSQVLTWLYWGGTLTALLTAMYTFRAFFQTFYGPEEIPSEAGSHAHESPTSMTVPLTILAVCALTVGWMKGDVSRATGVTGFLGGAPQLAYQALAHPELMQPGPIPEAHEQGAHDAHGQVATVSTIVVVLGIALAAFFYLGDQQEIRLVTRLVKPLYTLSHEKFFLDQIYTVLIVWPLRGVAWLSYWIDRHLLDRLVDLVARIPPWVGAAFRPLQTGLTQFYAVLMVLGLMALVGSLLIY